TDVLAGLRRDAVHRRISLFNPADPELVPSVSIHRELIGKRLDELSLVDEPGVSVEVDHAARFLRFDPEAQNIGLRMDGTVLDDKGKPTDAPLPLAIAVNGVVRATTRPYAFDGWRTGRWRAFVSPHDFTKGVNRVNVFVIRNAPQGVRLDQAFALKS